MQQIKVLLPNKTLDFDVKKFLSETSIYYQCLSENDKLLFEKKVKKFIYLKNFVAEDDLQKVTTEMKVLVASKAVQILFALPKIYLLHFPTIYLCASGFKGKDKVLYKGLTATNGYIKLSWEYFLDGEVSQSDGISLGLHEWAHALFIENYTFNKNYHFINPDYFKVLDMIYNNLKEEIRTGNSPIRTYGASNLHEFFSVVIEMFFEKPFILNKAYPELFELLVRMLHQNPLHLYKKQ